MVLVWSTFTKKGVFLFLFEWKWRSRTARIYWKHSSHTPALFPPRLVEDKLLQLWNQANVSTESWLDLFLTSDLMFHNAGKASVPLREAGTAADAADFGETQQFWLFAENLSLTPNILSLRIGLEVWVHLYTDDLWSAAERAPDVTETPKEDVDIEVMDGRHTHTLPAFPPLWWLLVIESSPKGHLCCSVLCIHPLHLELFWIPWAALAFTNRKVFVIYRFMPECRHMLSQSAAGLVRWPQVAQTGKLDFVCRIRTDNDPGFLVSLSSSVHSKPLN